MTRRGCVAVMLLSVTLSCSLFKKTVGNVGGSIHDAKETADTAGKLANKLSDLVKDLTPENEYYVGRSVATNILAKHDYQYLDKEAIERGRLQGTTQYINQVGAVLAATAVGEPRDGDRPAPLAGWHFVIVKSDKVNAFAAPGGYVFVTTAALKLAQSEDELAFVLAHEIAHVSRGHALGTIKKSRYADISGDALQATGAMSGEALGELTALLEGAIDDMIESFFVKGYSKDTEYEADKVGLAIAHAAGYDAQAGIDYLTRLAESQDTGKGGFHQTHPKASDRIARLKEQLPESKKSPKIRSKRFAKAVRKL